jgi:hypothetical protein
VKPSIVQCNEKRISALIAGGGGLHVRAVTRLQRKHTGCSLSLNYAWSTLGFPRVLQSELMANKSSALSDWWAGPICTMREPRDCRCARRNAQWCLLQNQLLAVTTDPLSHSLLSNFESHLECDVQCESYSPHLLCTLRLSCHGCIRRISWHAPLRFQAPST